MGAGKVPAILIQSPYCLHMFCTPTSLGPSSGLLSSYTLHQRGFSEIRAI